MDPYILLAKSAVEKYIKEEKVIDPPENLPPDFYQRKAGVFITIEKETKDPFHGERKKILRGCVGTYLPTKINVAHEIIDNALSAALKDFRFGPIQEAELPYLFYTVYVLSYPEEVKGLNELNPKKFGILVKTNPLAYPNKDVSFDGFAPFKSGLLLPDLEGVGTKEKQFLIACQKGRINPRQEKVFIYRFTAEKHDGK